jgi:SAM-dependent methyltransferase
MATAYNSKYYEDVYAGFENEAFARRWAIGCAITAGYADRQFGSVLEFGAGLGQNLAIIKAKSKWAVDVSEDSKNACRAKGFEWRGALAEIPDRTFDMILSRHSLEHVPEPRRVLLDLHKKSQGTQTELFLIVPLEDSVRVSSLKDFDEHRHLFSWSPETIKNLLLDTGWQPSQIAINNGRFFRKMTAMLPDHPKLFGLGRQLINRFTPSKSAEIIVQAKPR